MLPKTFMSESIAKEHFKLFDSFLGSKTNIKSKTNAKQKLAKLNKNQFSELSTDVFDELSRRKNGLDPFLTPNQAFHPKRNQARQKLATLPNSRFEELVSDVYAELVERNPDLKKEEEVFHDALDKSPSFKAALPQTESKEDQKPSKPANFANLDNLMADLDGMMTPSAFKSPDSSSTNHTNIDLSSTAKDSSNTSSAAALKAKEKQLQESTRKRHEYEQKIVALQNQIDQQGKQNRELVTIVEQAQKKAQEAENNSKSYKVQMDKALNDFNVLKNEFIDQERRTQDAKSETKSLMEELKTLSVENASLRGAKEKFTSQINELFIQIQDWKTKYEKEQSLRKQLEPELEKLKKEVQVKESALLHQQHQQQKNSIERPSSIMQKLKSKRENPNLDFDNDGIKGNSVFKLERMEEYYISVKQLLSESRAQEEPNTNILVAMKAVVIACKSITQDCDAFEKEHVAQDQKHVSTLQLMKKDMSQVLTYEMGLCKKFAVDPDEDISAKIEEAIRALTGIIAELYKYVSTILDPLSQYASSKKPAAQLSNLKTFLEQETDHIVSSIQSLLSILKASRLSEPDFDQSLDTITHIVTALVESCEQPLLDAGIDCVDLIQSLEDNRDVLQSLGNQLKKESANKSLKQQIASTSYEIAKHIKQLIELI